MREIFIRYKISLFTILLLVLVYGSFLPSLHNGWTSWDDDIYVTDNTDIREISVKTLSAVWSKQYNGSYLPVTLMSYMVEYSFGEYSPRIYHTTNLVLHYCNALLIFWFVFLFLNRQFAAAVISSLVFALHPMHVESVAWITGRKDLLCTLWMLLSMISYLKYMKTEKGKWLFSSFLFFVFAILSKVIAIVFPFILLLIDYYHKRTFSKKILFDKIPFFVVSVAFAYIGLLAQTYGHTIRESSVGNIFWVSQYALSFYLVKFFFPVRLSAVYPYPEKIQGWYSFDIYASVLFLLILGYLFWKNRNNDILVFGIFFFVLFIIPVLQLVRFSNILAADRFTYFAYTGLTLPLAVYLQKLFTEGSKQVRITIVSFGILFILIFMYLSNERCVVWQNSVTLWNDTLSKYPNQIH